MFDAIFVGGTRRTDGRDILSDLVGPRPVTWAPAALVLASVPRRLTLVRTRRA